MKNLSAVPQKLWPRVAWIAIAVAVAIVGLLGCHAVLSRHAEGTPGIVHPALDRDAGGEEELRHTATLTFTPVATVHLPVVLLNAGSVDKWALWTGGAQLRGANIYQRRVYPELDGSEFMGAGPVGPPYTQEDFDRLAALGANYVNVSHPGLFTEKPPHALDEDIQDNLDHLLDSIWQDQDAQDAWVDMWRYTAARYRDNPIVVGYDLMVEPNANEVGSHALNDPLDVWDPEEFYADYGGTLYDWNQLYPRISTAIREVDSDTPILIGGMAYSAVEWLPYLELTGDPHTVYMVHQYAPVQYTHQWWDSLDCAYPGSCDVDWDGEDEQFDRAWMEDLLSTIDTFITTHSVPVAVNEFGLMRWEPGADRFMDDQMDLFEQRGMNHALWVWDPSWEAWTEEVDAFNFRHGPDPDNHQDVVSSDLMDVIIKYWGRDTIRPLNGVSGSRQ